MASERAKGNSLPGLDLNFGDKPEGVDNEKDQIFYGATDEESAQCVGVRWALQVSSDDYRTMKLMVPTIVAEAIEQDASVPSVSQCFCRYCPFVVCFHYKRMRFHWTSI